jgi:hypothetical protein
MTAVMIPASGLPSASEPASAAFEAALYYLDLRGRLLHLLNETARRLQGQGFPALGHEPALGYLRTAAGERVRPEDLPLARAAREARPVEAAFILMRPGKPDCHVLWSAAPLGAPGGGATAVLATACLGPPPPDWQALAGLAHDLRTPLQSVRLLSSALVHPTAPEEGLALLQSAAERALQVGTDLLEWCRTPVQGGRRVQPAWFALEPFLADLVHEQAGPAANKGVILEGDLAAVPGWEAFTDRVRLGRVLANLLANAVRYTDPGGRVMLTTGWSGEGDRRELTLAVADTGAGIPAEEQDSIFQPFERGRAGREGDTSGSGLGLAVVDRLVRELGLRRELSSEFGRGSDFRIHLPRRLLRPAPVRPSG